MKKNYITCTSSDKAVTFMPNADGFGGILAIASQDGEYWFTLGWYKTTAGAKRAAVKQLGALGYRFNENELKALVIA